MPSVKVSVMIEVENEPLKGFPLVRRFEPTNESSFRSTLAAGAGYVTLASENSPGLAGQLQFFFVQNLSTSSDLNVRPTGLAASEIKLNKGGFIIIVDANGIATAPTFQTTSGGLITAIQAGT